MELSSTNDRITALCMRLAHSVEREAGYYAVVVPPGVDEGQRPFLVYAPVQTDKTAESMAEIYRETSEIRGERPPTPDEVSRAKDKKTLTLAGRWETADAVADSLAEVVRFGLPDDYWNTYPDRVRALSDRQISAAAADTVQPDGMVWVVVGDRAKIEQGIRDLGYGDIILMDADGNVLEGDNP
jgi:zinc protease